MTVSESLVASVVKGCSGSQKLLPRFSTVLLTLIRALSRAVFEVYCRFGVLSSVLLLGLRT
jgi:hypothetical protein